MRSEVLVMVSFVSMAVAKMGSAVATSTGAAAAALAAKSASLPTRSSPAFVASSVGPRIPLLLSPAVHSSEKPSPEPEKSSEF